MSDETFTSGGNSHKMTIYPAPADGKKHSMIVVVHGNAGLTPPFGGQIHSFAKSLAGLGYVTAVPQYYRDNLPHLGDGDPRPHVRTLSDAIAKVAARADADPDRLGLVGYSLGAATSMTYIASNAAGKVKVLVDFFGPDRKQSDHCVRSREISSYAHPSQHQGQGSHVRPKLKGPRWNAPEIC